MSLGYTLFDILQTLPKASSALRSRLILKISSISKIPVVKPRFWPQGWILNSSTTSRIPAPKLRSCMHVLQRKPTGRTCPREQKAGNQSDRSQLTAVQFLLIRNKKGAKTENVAAPSFFQSRPVLSTFVLSKIIGTSRIVKTCTLALPLKPSDTLLCYKLSHCSDLFERRDRCICKKRTKNS